jgi:hypothetical protein
MQRISIVGPGEYEDVVAELDFSPAFTAIVRNESGRFYIEIFNIESSQLEEFANGKRIARNTVDLEAFLESIKSAQAELSYQSSKGTRS